MVRVIRLTLRERLPHTGEIPFEKYRGFDYAQGVAETIAHQVLRYGRTDGVALLLQVICAQLFEAPWPAKTTRSLKTISRRSAASRVP